MKVTITATATLVLNKEKAGAWLANFKIETPIPNGVGGFDREVMEMTTAWKNASAGKRWLKAMVQERTPRKSIKLNVVEERDSKPIHLTGTLEFKK